MSSSAIARGGCIKREEEVHGMGAGHWMVIAAVFDGLEGISREEKPPRHRRRGWDCGWYN